MAGQVGRPKPAEWVSLRQKRSERATIVSQNPATLRADRPDPSLRNIGLLRMTTKLTATHLRRFLTLLCNPPTVARSS